MFPRLLRALWGDLSRSEIKKFGVLSAILMFILGDYWLLRSLKDAIFADFVGFEWQPVAKIMSLIAIIFIVLGYSKLVDLLEKDKLFYLLCPIYGILFFMLSYFSAYPSVASLSETSIFYPFISWIPGKIIGWASYIIIESLGSLLVVLFWSFVASTTSTESAKKGYGMVLFVAQIGTISGPFFVAEYVETIGAPSFLAIGALLILFVPILIKLYTTYIPEEEFEQKGLGFKQKPKTGFWEGLKLLTSRPYVAGIFVIATFYEIVGIVLEFQMKIIAATQVYVTRDALAAFNGWYGIGVNTLTFFFALLGTSFFLRKFGLRFCLLSFPIIIGCVVCSVFFTRFLGVTDYSLMWILFAAMIIVKGLNYALNNPTKEVTYIPTSKDVKFKAKGWIDMFGARGMKGVGAGINTFFRGSMSALFLYGNIISLGIVGIWIIIAGFMGRAFDKLQQEDEIVE
jgi:ATP:ADP antiporter, AAA family